MIFGVDALVDAFLGDVAVKEGVVILDSLDKSLVFAELLPNVREVMLSSVVVGGYVEMRFSMSNESDFGFS